MDKTSIMCNEPSSPSVGTVRKVEAFSFWPPRFEPRWRRWGRERVVPLVIKKKEEKEEETTLAHEL